MTRISIIIPIYNSEKYLEDCLLSVCEQTFTDFEAILVDDGSKDRSGEICDEFAKRDSRFRVIHKKNEGVSMARNTGLPNGCRHSPLPSPCRPGRGGSGSCTDPTAC